MPQPQIHPLSPEPQTAARDFDEKNPYYAVLNMVIDPELGVGIADMGLIYRVQEHDGVVVVTMTLTSMGCPAGPQLTEDIDSVLRMQKGVRDVEIEVVWEPAWNPEMMNPQIRQMLFGGP
jgi:metal-sulfur cluster biosynthetic enzyme